MSDKLPVTGASGAEPPPGAPQEVSQPLQAGAGGMRRPQPGEPGYAIYQELLGTADTRERELAPLRVPGSSATQGGVAEAVDAVADGKLDPFYQRHNAAQASAAAPVAPKGRITRAQRQGTAARPAVPEGATDDRVATARVVAGVGGDPSASGDAAIDADHPAGGGAAAPPVAYVGDSTAPKPLPEPIDYRTMPAASDTDSPTRGIPRGEVRPGKEITGGFADQAALQYFALDGRELGILVMDMLDEVATRIENDLRFNEAITYPRVAVRVAVEVSGFGSDNNFTVDRLLPDANIKVGMPQTPLETARQVADEMCFVIIAAKTETDAAGEPIDPPDKIRVELGLTRPRKQMISGPGGSRQMVDVVG